MNRKQSILMPLLLLSVSAVFIAVLSAARTVSPGAFVIAALPLIVGAVLLIINSSGSESQYSGIAAVLYAFIGLTGVSLQLMLNSKQPLTIFIYSLTGVIAACICLLVFQRLAVVRLNTKIKHLKAMYAVILSMIFLFVVLMIFGTRVNGAKNWIFIGGISIQITEITKLLFFFFLYLLVQCEQSVKFKLTVGIITLFINGFFYILCSELATFFVILIVFIFTVFIFLYSKVSVLIMIISLSLIGGVLAAVFALYDSVAANTDFISQLIQKAHDRLVFTNTYQQDMALKAMLNGGLFGAPNHYRIDFFAQETDFAVAGLIQMFGLIYSLAVLIVSALIPVILFRCAAESDISNTPSYKAGVIAMLGLGVPQILVLGSNIGVIPTFGIGYSFLSAGGTQMIVDCILAAFVCTALNTDAQGVSDRMFESKKTRSYDHAKRYKKKLSRQN